MDVLPKEVQDIIFNLTSLVRWKSKFIDKSLSIEAGSECRDEKCKTLLDENDMDLDHTKEYFCDYCSNIYNPLSYYLFWYKIGIKDYLRTRGRYFDGKYVNYGSKLYVTANISVFTT